MAKHGSIRIIGGQWRGRNLPVPEASGLRPTTDRVRETLFNWLAPRIHGARCLDMFAGSGILGIEALSRGAGWVDFLELSPSVARAIAGQLNKLNASQCQVSTANALGWQAETPCDVVFIDPPFDAGLADAALEHLLNSALVAPDSRIYLEVRASDQHTVTDPRLSVLRDKKAGDVHYRLLEVLAH